MSTNTNNNSSQNYHPKLSWTVWLAGILAVLFIGLVTIELVFAGIAGYLIIADPLEKADAVVILSGGTESRMGEAATLYKEEYAKLFVLTETGAQLQGYDQTYIDYLIEQALDLEIPYGAIRVTAEHAYNTTDEARAVKDLLRREGSSSVIVVTDPYHTRRARLVFRDVFQDTDIKVIVRPVINTWYRSSTWWTTPQGWEITINEYVRLLAYWAGL